MAQRLKALSAPAENLGPVPSSSQSPVTPVSEHSTPSSDLLGYPAYMWCTYTHVHKTLIQITECLRRQSSWAVPTQNCHVLSDTKHTSLGAGSQDTQARHSKKSLFFFSADC